MAIDGFSWTTILDSQVDPDSPVDTILMTGLRDDAEFLMRWLGRDYLAGAIANHDHDGLNSKKVSAANLAGVITPGAGTVRQAQLVTAYEEQSATLPSSGVVNLIFVAGGEFYFYPHIRTFSSTPASAPQYLIKAFAGTLFTSYVTVVGINGGVVPNTYYARMRYITASPPWPMGELGSFWHWMFFKRNTVTGEILAASVCDEPPWRLIHPLLPKSSTARMRVRGLPAGDHWVAGPDEEICLLDPRPLQNKVVMLPEARALADFLAKTSELTALGATAEELADAEAKLRGAALAEARKITLVTTRREELAQRKEEIAAAIEERVTCPVTKPKLLLQLDENYMEADGALAPLLGEVVEIKKLAIEKMEQGVGIIDSIHDQSLDLMVNATRNLSDPADPDHAKLPQIPGLFIPGAGGEAPRVKVLTVP